MQSLSEARKCFALWHMDGELSSRGYTYMLYMHKWSNGESLAADDGRYQSGFV